MWNLPNIPQGEQQLSIYHNKRRRCRQARTLPKKSLLVACHTETKIGDVRLRETSLIGKELEETSSVISKWEKTHTITHARKLSAISN